MLKKIFLFLILLITPQITFAEGISSNIEDGIYTFKIPLKKYGEKLKPYVAQELTTTSDLFKTGNYKLVVNGGYFDIMTGAPVSNVIIEGKRAQSIFQNPELLKKLDDRGRAEDVINRTEFRILKDKNGFISYDIAEHFEKTDKTILHSIQAGPMILPSMRLVEESFIKYKNGKIIGLAADVLKRRERTIIGLKHEIAGEYLYIVIFSNEHKADFNEAREYCIKLGLDKAMGMDGGASTSINFNDIEVFSATDGQRRVKSFLVIEK